MQKCLLNLQRGIQPVSSVQNQGVSSKKEAEATYKKSGCQSEVLHHLRYSPVLQKGCIHRHYLFPSIIKNLQRLLPHLVEKCKEFTSSFHLAGKFKVSVPTGDGTTLSGKHHTGRNLCAQLHAHKDMKTFSHQDFFLLHFVLFYKCISAAVQTDLISALARKGNLQ